MVISPEWRSTTIRREMSRPRPVPLPTSLVVKNGSKTRSSTFGGMPVPVSQTEMATYSPAGMRPSSTMVRFAQQSFLSTVLAYGLVVLVVAAYVASRLVSNARRARAGLSTTPPVLLAVRAVFVELRRWRRTIKLSSSSLPSGLLAANETATMKCFSTEPLLSLFLVVCKRSSCHPNVSFSARCRS